MTRNTGLLSAAPRPAWQPPKDLVDHNGAPVPAEARFAVPPPAEIGALRSAHTDFSTASRGVPAWLLGGGALSLAVALAVYVLTTEGRWDTSAAAWGPAVLAFAATLFVCYLIPWSSSLCTYVGAEGVARYKLGRGGDSVRRAEVMRFDEATEVRTGATRHYHNGIYTGTQFFYHWTDPAGARRFVVKGSHYKEKPKPSDLVYFGRAAELAWSEWLLDRADAELRARGYLQFNVKGGDWVRVGPGLFEFRLRGQEARCEVADIKSLTIHQGMVSIVHKDAKWFSRQGKFSFPYAQLANAKLFLLALDKLIGYRFG